MQSSNVNSGILTLWSIVPENWEPHVTHLFISAIVNHPLWATKVYTKLNIINIYMYTIMWQYPTILMKVDYLMTGVKLRKHHDLVLSKAHCETSCLPKIISCCWRLGCYNGTGMRRFSQMVCLYWHLQDIPIARWKCCVAMLLWSVARYYFSQSLISSYHVPSKGSHFVQIVSLK